MKNFFLLFLLFLAFFSCKKETIQAPKNLIEKETMQNIIYDIALLEVLKSDTAQYRVTSRKIDPSTYIFKKYKIDSTLFAKSNKYYATNINEYSKMYETVIKRIEDQKAAIDTLIARKNKAQTSKYKKK
jgi:hypothetical protein